MRDRPRRVTTTCAIAVLVAAACGVSGDRERSPEAAPAAEVPAPAPAADVAGDAGDAMPPDASRRRVRCADLESQLPPLEALSAAQLDSLLAVLRTRLPVFEDRLRALVLARIGQPYALGTLGEESGQDPDPIFRLDEADCTVLVLTTTALAHARSIADARAWMGPANYREQHGTYPVTYENRLHFTSDRITGSPLFEDLTDRIVRPDERRSVELTLNRKADGQHLLPIDWEREIVIDYVPAANLEPLLERLPAIAGIAFVHEGWRDRGLVVAHEGFLVDRRCLVHASSMARRVVALDVMDYLWRRTDSDSTRRGTARFDGAILYALRDATDRIDPDRTILPVVEGTE